MQEMREHLEQLRNDLQQKERDITILNDTIDKMLCDNQANKIQYQVRCSG